MFKFLPNSQSVAIWLSKWLELKSSLGVDPANSFAWRWCLRLKILAYLMSRYGVISADLGVSGQEMSRPSFVSPPSSSKLLRSGSSIRMALTRIADLNKYKLGLDEVPRLPYRSDQFE